MKAGKNTPDVDCKKLFMYDEKDIQRETLGHTLSKSHQDKINKKQSNIKENKEKELKILKF